MLKPLLLTTTLFLGPLAAALGADVQPSSGETYLYNGISARPTTAPDPPTPAPPGVSWGLDRIDDPGLPLDGSYDTNSSGAGVHVYVLSTGVRDTHVDLEGRATRDLDYGGDGRQGRDCHGAGTVMAGLIAGRTHGVAKGARIHSIRVTGCNGLYRPGTMAAAIDWVTAHAQHPAIVVLGGNARYLDFEVNLDDAAQRALWAGLVVIAPVSDRPYRQDACMDSPANLRPLLIVSSSTREDKPQASAYVGSCVDLYAPGTDLVSLSHESDTEFTQPWVGTALAAAHTAGVAALIWQESPTLTNYQVMQDVVARAAPGRLSDLYGATPNLLLQSLARPLDLPNQLVVIPSACWGGNDATWGTVPDATFYELYSASSTAFNPQTLQYRGPNGWASFDVTRNSYMRVRACNAQGCGPYRNGNQMALYAAGCF